ncbi:MULTISPECIES: hypothetical protein [Burkholderia]|uniref:Uncharacterized protein n=1 Tax=Burkholderia pseudomallei TaxID=28450 RepID=A0A8A4DMJ9_BURPE|nr:MULTISPECIES: hypothetical protein [Burkholderia]ABN85948.1 hypothetical protein BURPS668_A0811 [Burkholderia pseudomallei 668]ABN87774.1 hypothetical protein BURPS668_A1920 [Burkholderia pseudomallei 668]MBO7751942.1 hypothetical protein [Burkholderia pseudomallei]QWM23633.1 hypothetical protein J3D99_027360 [Burkholderia pseudomallei]QWM25846.1 hypothetical protein J3D99_018560 [Burkholderia pseudomallei]
MRAEHHVVAARGQRPAHPQQRVHVPRRPDRRHDYLSHRLVIPFRAAVAGAVRRSPCSNRIVHRRPGCAPPGCTPLRRARRASCPRAPHLPAWLPAWLPPG